MIKNYSKNFKILKQNKERKILFYKPEILFLAKKFINKYNKFLENLETNTQN